MARLTRRHCEALARLLAGDSEKQVARRLGISYHTAHGYVKDIYRAFGVHTRAKLLAAFIPRRTRIEFSAG